MARIGIFGGSFDPVHVGHLVLAEWARVERELDEVLFVPAGRPPHKPAGPLAPAEHRLRMLELAVGDNAAFRVSRVELDAEGPCYTLLTVRRLKGQRPDGELFLLMGGDSLLDLPNWWRAEELASEVAVIAFDRPGALLADGLDGLASRFGEGWARRVMELRVEAPLLQVSATAIRQRVRRGLSVRYLVPEPVRRYIEQHGLYAAG